MPSRKQYIEARDIALEFDAGEVKPKDELQKAMRLRDLIGSETRFVVNGRVCIRDFYGLGW